MELQRFETVSRVGFSLHRDDAPIGLFSIDPRNLSNAETEQIQSSVLEILAALEFEQSNDHTDSHGRNYRSIILD